MKETRVRVRRGREVVEAEFVAGRRRRRRRREQPAPRGRGRGQEVCRGGGAVVRAAGGRVVRGGVGHLKVVVVVVEVVAHPMVGVVGVGVVASHVGGGGRGEHLTSSAFHGRVHTLSSCPTGSEFEVPAALVVWRSDFSSQDTELRHFSIHAATIRAN